MDRLLFFLSILLSNPSLLSIIYTTYSCTLHWWCGRIPTRWFTGTIFLPTWSVALWTRDLTRHPWCSSPGSDRIVESTPFSVTKTTTNSSNLSAFRPSLLLYIFNNKLHISFLSDSHSHSWKPKFSAVSFFANWRTAIIKLLGMWAIEVSAPWLNRLNNQRIIDTTTKALSMHPAC